MIGTCWRSLPPSAPCCWLRCRCRPGRNGRPTSGTPCTTCLHPTRSSARPRPPPRTRSVSSATRRTAPIPVRWQKNHCGTRLWLPRPMSSTHRSRSTPKPSSIPRCSSPWAVPSYACPVTMAPWHLAVCASCAEAPRRRRSP